MDTAQIFALTSTLAASTLAVIAAYRAFKTGHSVAEWAFFSGILVLAAERILSGFALRQASPEAVAQCLQYRIMVASLVPGCWLLFSLTYARDNARDFLRRWRFAMVAAFLLPVATSILFRHDLVILKAAGNQVPYFELGPTGLLHCLFLLVGSILVLMNLESTFRASTGLFRWRIKFMLMGVALLFIIRLFTVSQALLYGELSLTRDAILSGALIISTLFIIRAVFRDEPLGMHVHPSQAVLQGSLTVLLVGVYLVLVGIMASLVTYWGGDDSFAIKSFLVLVAVAGLAVLLQSDRVNLHLRRFVSRHFQRPLHDYQAVWSRFTDATASRVEQPDLCQAIAKLLADTFNALSVSVWLVDESRNDVSLAFSTSVNANRAHLLKPDANAIAAIIARLGAHPDPVDIEQLPDEWAASLRRCHPDEFNKGGTRVCVPIVSRNEVMGFVLLGDRVGGAAFALQDLDLLKSIGEHIASALLNIRLSHRLLQAREHEAFQTMAAFFVHDLKNAASTLSLMLQNLPTHFDDPEFREDALRAVGKSVAHINHLISRLSALRAEMKIKAVPADLNGIVAGVLGGFEKAPDFATETDFATLPPVPVDREQFSKVVMNLVLNAREAANGRGGRLLLSTAQAGAWVVLTAADDGCGMSAEFISQSLFRPFQTTKKNGLGIGMFQSKMIVEAHGGRIAVESTPGQGTTFRVFLPLSANTQ